MLKRVKQWHKKLAAHRWVQGGILGLIVGIFATMMVLLALQWIDRASLDHLLPAESTAAYVELNREEVMASFQEAPSDFRFNSTTLLSIAIPGNSTEKQFPSWVGDHVGVAWMNTSLNRTDPVFFWEVQDAKAMGQALQEAPFASLNAMQWNNYVILTESAEAARSIQEVRNGKIAPLQKNPYFLRVRPHLAYDAPVFGYGEVSKMSELLVFPAIFQAAGFVVEDDPAGARLQTYFLGDKEVTEGQPIFHADAKYKGVLRDYFPAEVDVFWGGINGLTSLEQLNVLLDATAQNENAWKEFLSQNLNLSVESPLIQEVIQPFWESEYAVVEWENSIVATDVTTEEAAPLTEESSAEAMPPAELNRVVAFHLSDAQKKAWTDFVEDLVAKGRMELNAEGDTLRYQEVQSVEHSIGNFTYRTLQSSGDGLIHFAEEDGKLFMTEQAKAMEALLMEWGNPSREFLEASRQVIAFGDQVLELEPSRMNTLFPLPGASRLFSGFSGFDDGVQTVHIIEF